MPSPPPDPETERFLQDSLEPGEVIRWSAAPLPGRLVARALPAATASLAIFVVAAGLVLQRQSPGGPPPAELLWLSAIIVFLLGSLVWAFFAARRTVYAVTNRRAVIAQPQLFGNPRIRPFAPPFLGLGEVAARSDGGGDLVLGTVAVRGRYGTRQRPIGFFGLADLEAAKQALRALTDAASIPAEGGAVPVPLSTTPLRMTAVFFGLIGAGFLSYGAYTALLAYRSTDWPTAAATIVSSRVRVSGGRHISYAPEVGYEYDVQGRTYPGDRVSFGGGYNRYTASQTVRRYPAGTMATASYDPSDPARSVLEPGPQSSLWLMPAVGLGFLVAAGVSLCANPQGRRAA